MTLNTVLPEFIIVDIFMATGAIFERNSGKFLHPDSVIIRHFMTCFAFNRNMFTSQFEPGFLMIKFGSRGKLRIIMTGRTIGGKSALMGILVAGNTIPFKSKVGRLLFMTISTMHFGMGSQ